MHAILLAALLASLPVISGSGAAASQSGGTHNPWAIRFSPEVVPAMMPAATALIPAELPPLQSDAQGLHTAAVEHSPAYMRRRKIHKIASFATLPLFGTELLIGQSLYDNGGETKKAAHIAIGSGIVGLFGLNTVTGLWNLLGEDRRDPSTGKLRWTHAILMMAADAGFAATSMTGPNERSFSFASDRSLHRDLAVASIGAGTAGYLLMLLHR